MISLYPTLSMKTPGGAFVSVNVVKRNQEVKQDRRKLMVPLVDESGLRFVAAMAQEAVEHERDCFIIVTGDRGGGKSTAIQKCARLIDPEFDPAKQVAFSLEQFERIFNENPQGNGRKGIYPQVVMDEAGHALYGPQWLVREQQVVAKQMIISRIKRQIIWLAVPKRKQLNNQVRDMARIWIHVTERKEYQQGYAIVRIAPVELQSEFYAEKYWEPKLVFHFTEERGPAWDAYEARKIEFVNEVTREIAEGRAIKGGKAVDGRNNMIREYVRYRKRVNDPISTRDLEKYAGISFSKIADIIRENPKSPESP